MKRLVIALVFLLAATLAGLPAPASDAGTIGGGSPTANGLTPGASLQNSPGGGVGIIGNQGTGADFINGACRDGICPVTAWSKGVPITGTTTITCTATSGSAVLTSCSGTGSLVNNQPVVLIQGGQTNPLTTPTTAPTVTTRLASGANSDSDGTYFYEYTALDANEGETAPSSATAGTTANTFLNGGNQMTAKDPVIAGAVLYKNYGYQGSGGSPFFLGWSLPPSGSDTDTSNSYFGDFGNFWAPVKSSIASITGTGTTVTVTLNSAPTQAIVASQKVVIAGVTPAQCQPTVGKQNTSYNGLWTIATVSSTTVFTITNAAACAGTTTTASLIGSNAPGNTIAPPVSSLPDNLYTTVASGGGTTTITLATPALQNGTLTLEPDAATAIQACANYAAVNPNDTCLIPAGNYLVSKFIKVTQGSRIEGQCTTPNGSIGSQLLWGGANDGELMVDVFNTQFAKVSCLFIKGANLASGSAAAAMTDVYVDADNTLGNGGGLNTVLSDLTLVGHVGLQNGGKYCNNLVTTQPSCDTSKLSVDRVFFNGTTDVTNIGILLESSNAGDLSEYSHIFCANIGNACFLARDSASLAGIVSYLNAGAAVTGVVNQTAIKLESGGSWHITNEQSQIGTGAYDIWVPPNTASASTGAIEIDDSGFNANVSFDSQAVVYSYSNFGGSTSLFYNANVSGGVQLFSMGDNLKSFCNGNAPNNGGGWCAGPAGVTFVDGIQQQFGRNGNTGTKIMMVNAPLIPGSMSFLGSTSGTALLQATAAAGAPTLSLPTATGTLISNATKGAVFATATVAVTAPTAVGCTDATVAVASSTTAMTVTVAPQANPNGTSGAVSWSGYISSAGTADVRVCNAVTETSPPSTTYNVTVLN